MKRLPVLFTSLAGVVLAAVLIGGWILAPQLSEAIMNSGGPDGAITVLQQVMTLSAQLLGTFVAILVVYVVFKLSNVFVRLEEAEQGDWTGTDDIRVDRSTQHRYQRLLELKKRYVRPLALPVTVMAVILGLNMVALPFVSLLHDAPVAALRIGIISATATAASILWATRVAFGSAIEA